MKSIKVSILNRQYPLVVKHEDEQIMIDIATFVDKRLRDFKKDLVNQTETTILVLTCLSIAEELFTLKNKLASEPEKMDQINNAVKSLISEIKAYNTPQ